MEPGKVRRLCRLYPLETNAVELIPGGEIVYYARLLSGEIEDVKIFPPGAATFIGPLENNPEVYWGNPLSKSELNELETYRPLRNPHYWDVSRSLSWAAGYWAAQAENAAAETETETGKVLCFRVVNDNLGSHISRLVCVDTVTEITPGGDIVAYSEILPYLPSKRLVNEKNLASVRAYPRGSSPFGKLEDNPKATFRKQLSKRDLENLAKFFSRDLDSKALLESAAKAAAA